PAARPRRSWLPPLVDQRLKLRREPLHVVEVERLFVLPPPRIQAVGLLVDATQDAALHLQAFGFLAGVRAEDQQRAVRLRIAAVAHVQLARLINVEFPLATVGVSVPENHLALASSRLPARPSVPQPSGLPSLVSTLHFPPPPMF